MKSNEVESVLKELMVNNLFLCSYLDGKECLKNEKDEIVFSFKLEQKFTTLECLQKELNKLKGIVDFAINNAG